MLPRSPSGVGHCHLAARSAVQTALSCQPLGQLLWAKSAALPKVMLPSSGSPRLMTNRHGDIKACPLPHLGTALKESPQLQNLPYRLRTL